LLTWLFAVAATAVPEWAVVRYKWNTWEDHDKTVTYGPWKDASPAGIRGQFPGNDSVQDVNKATTIMGCVLTFLYAAYYCWSGLYFISLLTELILGSVLLAVGIVSWAGFGAWVDHFPDDGELKSGHFVKVKVLDHCADGCRLQAVCAASYTLLGLAMIFIAVSPTSKSPSSSCRPRGARGCCACDCSECDCCCCCVADDGAVAEYKSALDHGAERVVPLPPKQQLEKQQDVGVVVDQPDKADDEAKDREA